MRYGCVPIVSAVGGLKDSIFPDETGFVIEKPTAMRLANAIKKALGVYPERESWEAMQKAGMSQDFSWRVSARQYFQLYQRVVAQLSPR
jgi:starch synthase